MSKTKFDISDIKTEAQRGLHAYVGAADLAIETLKDYVSGAQKTVQDFDFQPRALRKQATTVVSSRVDELSKDAKARRDAVEKRVAVLQADAQKFVSGNVETAADTYDDLVKRGETILRRFRNQPAAKETVANAKTTVAKVKTTNTQARKTAKKATAQAKDQAKKTTAKVSKTAKESPATSSAKATGTAAKKTVASAAKTVS